MQRALGMRWKCFACGLSFDEENYSLVPVEKTNVDARDLCITRGHWRQCNACQSAPPTEDNIVVQCVGLCGQKRPRVHFAEGASVCNACILYASKELHTCSRCNRIKRHDEIDTQAHVCYACAPELNPLQCTVCGLDRPAADFKGNSNEVRKRAISTLPPVPYMQDMWNFLRQRCKDAVELAFVLLV